jgi:transcriptional regulator with GAF, ATPase, and Fis domain
MNPPQNSLLTQLEERIRFETLLADLSARFVGLPPEALDREIEEAQRRICETLGLDRSTLGQPSQDGVPQFTHAWAIPGCMPAPHSPAAPLFPWATRQIQSGHTLRFSSVEELPPEAATDKETFRRVETKSCVCFPLLVGGKAMGALSFGTVKAERQWPDELVSRLRLIAEVFANALARRSSEEALHNALKTVEALKERVEAENVSLRQDLQLLDGHPEILGRSPTLQEALAQAEKVAATNASVLLLGETGTGKELVAAAIHDLSPRRVRPMVRVNCAAIPSNLIESELFGREKGAYTGALSRQIGRFESAHGSTIFLDEIGELPPEVQVKLLRVLQEKQIERLGNPTPIAVDVRIISATNCDLAKAVGTGKFREDLYYRLNVFPIRLPPLRERPEDIPILVRAFLEQFSAATGHNITSIPKSTLDALQHYHWPGNVRELRNVIERAVILSRGPKLAVELPGTHQPIGRPSLLMKDVERDHLLRVLEQTGWRLKGKGGAAEILGLKRTTLQSRMTKLGLRRPKP